jgi:hypothetical protein
MSEIKRKEGQIVVIVAQPGQALLPFTDSRQTAERQQTDSRQTADREQTDSRQTADRQQTDTR